MCVSKHSVYRSRFCSPGCPYRFYRTISLCFLPTPSTKDLTRQHTHKTQANTPRGHMYREHSGCILTLLRIHPPLSSFNTQPDICLILILTKNNRLINISISPFTSRTSNALLLNCHILRSDHTHANQLYRWIVILSFYPWAHSLSLSFSLSMSVP